ncbi:MAG TPA: hypothetical protein VNT22_02170 [Baekduia sp.]|nr:hypothetical protein [Baekduia sp.]
MKVGSNIDRLRDALFRRRTGAFGGRRGAVATVRIAVILVVALLLGYATAGAGDTTEVPAGPAPLAPATTSDTKGPVELDPVRVPASVRPATIPRPRTTTTPLTTQTQQTTTPATPTPTPKPKKFDSVG